MKRAVLRLVVSGSLGVAVLVPTRTIANDTSGLLHGLMSEFAPATDGGAGIGCVGDCNGDGRVSINELVIGVLIALGFLPVNDCPAFDANRDGLVTIPELITAVGEAQTGCMGPPGGRQSICGGPITSAPKLCDLRVAPERVLQNDFFVVSFGLSDLEGDLEIACLGFGSLAAGVPPLQCMSDPSLMFGTTINFVLEIGSLQAAFPVGQYILAVQFIDSTGAASQIATASFEVFFLRR